MRLRATRPILAGVCAALLAGLAPAGPAGAEPAAPPAASAQSPAPLGAIRQPIVRSERNAAYFNRPGAIPLTLVGSATPAATPSPSEEEGAASVTPRKNAPAPRPPAGPARLIRPAPVAPRTGREPHLVVRQLTPPPVAQPRIFPAHPAGTRAAAAVTAVPRTPAEALIETAGSQTQKPIVPVPRAARAEPGVIFAPRPAGQGIRRAVVPVHPPSQTTGTLPTLPPRPASTISPPAANQLPSGPAALVGREGGTELPRLGAPAARP